MKLDKNYGYIIVADDDNLTGSSQLDGDDFRNLTKWLLSVNSETLCMLVLQN